MEMKAKGHALHGGFYNGESLSEGAAGKVINNCEEQIDEQYATR